MGFIKASELFPPLIASFVAAYALFELQPRVLGGRKAADIPSMSPAWKEAEKERFLNMEREGAPDEPVIMNPIRHEIPAQYKNKADLDAIGS